MFVCVCACMYKCVYRSDTEMSKRFLEKIKLQLSQKKQKLLTFWYLSPIAEERKEKKKNDSVSSFFNFAQRRTGFLIEKLSCLHNNSSERNMSLGGSNVSQRGNGAKFLVARAVDQRGREKQSAFCLVFVPRNRNPCASIHEECQERRRSASILKLKSLAWCNLQSDAKTEWEWKEGERWKGHWKIRNNWKRFTGRNHV